MVDSQLRAQTEKAPPPQIPHIPKVQAAEAQGGGARDEL
jgi:hypothetical protein